MKAIDVRETWQGMLLCCYGYTFLFNNFFLVETLEYIIQRGPSSQEVMPGIHSCIFSNCFYPGSEYKQDTPRTACQSINLHLREIYTHQSTCWLVFFVFWRSEKTQRKPPSLTWIKPGTLKLRVRLSVAPLCLLSWGMYWNNEKFMVFS